MGRISGDKARYNRKRRAKLARRVEMRALRRTLGPGGTETPEPGAATAAAARPSGRGK